MEEILKFLRTISPHLEEECQDFLRTVAERELVKKGQILLQPGETCRKLYFIKTELLICQYKVNEEDEKDITEWFFWESHTVVDIDGWYTQTPGTRCIQALEDCELFSISYENLEDGYNRFHKLEHIGRILTIKYLLIWNRLLEAMRLPTALERYKWLLKHQPEALLRVPQKYIASLLGMTPETFSRMRGQI